MPGDVIIVIGGNGQNDVKDTANVLPPNIEGELIFFCPQNTNKNIFGSKITRPDGDKNIFHDTTRYEE